MSDITVLLNAVQPGDPAAAGQLLPLVYDDLRRPAVHRLAHEAYRRLGIDLVSASVSWVMLGLAVRHIPTPGAPHGSLPGQPVGVRPLARGRGNPSRAPNTGRTCGVGIVAPGARSLNIAQDVPRGDGGGVILGS
jgi:hypothetical protein